MFVNRLYPGKSLQTSFESWKTVNLVFESRGKQCVMSVQTIACSLVEVCNNVTYMRILVCIYFYSSVFR